MDTLTYWIVEEDCGVFYVERVAENGVRTDSSFNNQYDAKVRAYTLNEELLAELE